MATKRIPPESPSALRAFEDYWDLGDDRSLDKLTAKYTALRAAGEGVPSGYRRQIARWSSNYNWQARLTQRVGDEATRRRRKFRERIDRVRERAMNAIEADLGVYSLKVAKGEAALAEDAASLEKMLKLFFQLADEPLADRHELTGANGGPVEVDIPPNGDLARFLRNAADLAISTQAGGDVPGEAGGD